MTDTGSSVPRRQLGRHLRRAREEARISPEAAALELECSRAKIYRIEGGDTSVRAIDVKAMCALYECPEELTEALVALARESKAKGWWASHGDVPEWFELFLGLESSASCLRQFESSVVPGLLQTEEYAAALYGTHPAMTERDVHKAVSLRMERQQLLYRRIPRPPKLNVILDEAVLRRWISNSEDMRVQLDHLVLMAEMPGNCVRIFPSSVGPHRVQLAGDFVILDFPSGRAKQVAEPTTVYSESVTGALYLDKPKEVEVYENLWTTLDRLSLSPDDSKLMIQKAKER